VVLSCKFRILRWTIQAGIHQAAPKRIICLLRGWDATKIRTKGAGSGGTLKAWLGWYGHASTSNHHGQARMEWNSGREASVWERTMVTLVGATPIKCVFFFLGSSSVSPSPHVYHATVAQVKAREVLP